MVRLRRKDIDFKYNLKLYWGLLRNYKVLLVGALFLILVLESTFVLDKFLFKIIVDKGGEFAGGSLLKGDFVNILLIVFGVYAGISIFRAIGDFTKIHLVNILDAHLIIDLKRKFFNHIISLDHEFHTTNKTGSLISRLVRGGGAIESMTDVVVFNFAPLVFQLIVVSFSLAYFSWIPALITLLTVITFISYSFIMQKRQENISIKARDAEDFEKANISDMMTNIDSIKYFGKDDLVKRNYHNIAKKTRRAELKVWHHFRSVSAIQALILSVGILLLIYFPIKQFLAGEITIGTVVFIYTAFVTLMGPLFGFIHGMRHFYRIMADFEVLFQYNKQKKTVKDKPNAKKLEIKNGEIEFKKISFSYTKRKIFPYFNLKIKKNEKVAFVGHSGCGKTTLVKLLYRFYDVNSGEILIDGKDIRNFSQESLREELSIVPQECVLFDDTIFNNVKFSNPRATDGQVLKAMKFAQLDKIVNLFPKKEKTIVGERGVRLSGGEKQRVSIARAILANKKILVLDEATSSLDSETEHEIQKDLKKLLEGRTSIIIAHRLSTIMNADRIIVLKKGKIVQQGKHRDLIKQPGEYKKLWNLQKGGYIE